MNIDEKIRKLELDIRRRNAFEMAKLSLENNEIEKVERYVSFYKQLSDEYHNLEMKEIQKERDKNYQD